MRYLALLLALGCADGDPDSTAPDAEANAPDQAVGDAAPDMGTQRGECPSREDNGRILTCAALDRCEEVPPDFQLACCQCDTRYCQPDPACEPQPDPFAEQVLPLLDRLCAGCHAGAPNPMDASLTLYLSPANPPASLDDAQLAANRDEVEGFIDRGNPAASPLAARPTGQSHPAIYSEGDADHAALVGWIEGLE